LTVREVETDYLVVGAGASGMAFADTLLAHTDAEVVLVDRRHRPGGHWLDAYPFVRLRQPSAYYGVESRALGRLRVLRGADLPPPRRSAAKVRGLSDADPFDRMRSESRHGLGRRAFPFPPNLSVAA
jgi:2-polyprenyl-6-methoxyphenol hydroxylase-like FAD-dependent oxidoreductase